MYILHYENFRMSVKIKIGLVDDKAVNRTNITEKLKQFSDLDLCFVAINGHDCLEQLKGLPTEKLPQVIFMDLEMPELDGIQTIRIARTLYPWVNFIVLTIFDDDDKIFEAIKAGAHGYLLKDENAVALRSAVSNVLESGGAPMSPAIARKAFNLLGRSQVDKKTKVETDHYYESILTEREKEILLQTINGLDAKQIASLLNISVLTIRKHIANIYHKLHVNSKAQVISLAHRQNWFQD